MKQYIITEDQLAEVEDLVYAEGQGQDYLAYHINRICEAIRNNELNQEFPNWGTPMNAQ